VADSQSGEFTEVQGRNLEHVGLPLLEVIVTRIVEFYFGRGASASVDSEKYVGVSTTAIDVPGLHRDGVRHLRIERQQPIDLAVVLIGRQPSMTWENPLAP